MGLATQEALYAFGLIFVAIVLTVVGRKQTDRAGVYAVGFLALLWAWDDLMNMEWFTKIPTLLFVGLVNSGKIAFMSLVVAVGLFLLLSISKKIRDKGRVRSIVAGWAGSIATVVFGVIELARLGRPAVEFTLPAIVFAFCLLTGIVCLFVWVRLAIKGTR